jgi:arsenate reductase-like glutaredoxin family protein
LQELLGEFDPFKKKLDTLRTKGSDLIKHSSDPVEKQTIQKALADTNRSWSTVQTKAGEKTRQLKEADQLAKSFTETAEAIERWLEQSEEQITVEPTWVDFDKVRDQLKSSKVSSYL